VRPARPARLPDGQAGGPGSDAQESGAPLPSTPQGSPAETPHRFSDWRNRWLFAGVAAARTLDYTSTRNIRHRGRDEILLTNDIVDNRAAFAAIEAAGTAASVGTSYLFHRSGHHKLERWTSYVHIGVGMGGAIRNYSLKTRRVRPAGL